MSESSNPLSDLSIHPRVEAVLVAGSLYRTKECGAWFVPSTGGSALDVSSRQFRNFVGEVTGLSPTSKKARAVVEALAGRAARAPVALVQRLSRFEKVAALPGAHAVTVHLGAGALNSYTPTGVTQVPNGTASCVFADERDFEPVDREAMARVVPGKPGSCSALRRALLDDLPPPATDSGLTADEQRAIVLACWLGIFIGPIAKARPILLFLGPAGCGKTTVQRLIATLFYGGDGDVGGSTSLDRVMKDMAATSVHRSLVVRDDVNDLPPGAADVLCRSATGTTFQVAQFHETLDLATYRANAALCLSAFQPGWLGRADLNSRLLILRFGRPPATTVSERDRQARALLERPGAWAETLSLLSVLTLPAAPIHALTRFDDWEAAVRRMLAVAGMEADFVSALRKMDGERNRSVRDADPVLDVLADLALDTSVSSRWFSAVELSDLIQSRFGVKGTDGQPHLATAQARDPQRLGQLLAKLSRENGGLFEVHRRRAHDNKSLWAITPARALPPRDTEVFVLDDAAADGGVGGSGGAGGSTPSPTTVFLLEQENGENAASASPPPSAPNSPEARLAAAEGGRHG